MCIVAALVVCAFATGAEARVSAYQALQLSGCSLDSMWLCTVSDFVTLMNDAIAPAWVAAEA